MPFRTALSGLNAASSELRVVGNNVANSATVGFKKSRAEFADIYAVSNLGVSSNAIGSGVKVSSISQEFTQGNIGFTDNNLDLAISGQGFFRLSENGVISYTRAGQFSVDREGYVVNSADQRLTTYQADSSGAITGALGDLRLDTSDITPKATSTIDVGVNLDATSTAIATPFDPNDPTTYHGSTSLTVYDSLGSPHLGSAYYVKTAPNTWDTHLYVDNAAVTPAAGSTITFNPDGTLATPAGGTIAYNAFAVAGADPLNITLDYASLTPSTQFGSNFSVNSLTQDGFATGRLSGIDIDDSGIVQARYSNGQSKALGQVALANFSNPGGMRQLGGNNWSETFDSGAALIGQPGSASLGLVQSGALEGSNVDLTEQLVKMITAQRNFQANAQVISTADTVTQTIINIR